MALSSSHRMKPVSASSRWLALLVALLGAVAPLQRSHAGAISHSAAGLERWCADQGRRVVSQGAWGSKVSDIYHTHYNFALRKCFMTIEVRRGHTTAHLLVDAYALRTYASSFSMAEAPALSRCVLMPTDRSTTNCTGSSEYDAYVAQYMEQQ